MKTFVLFLAICVFALTMALLELNGRLSLRKILLWSIVVTAVFSGLMVWFSVETFFFLYYAHFLGGIVLIPCLTYLIYKLSNNTSSKIEWIRILGLGLVSVFLTFIICSISTVLFVIPSNGPCTIQIQSKS
jgi:ABC-type Co2+ transport system permease subunit